MNEQQVKELLSMDWGEFTPEFSRGNEMVHVLNHCIATPEDVRRTVQFIVSRIQWCNTYLRNEFLHTVVIDDVGQRVSDETRELIRNEIKDHAASVTFASERDSYGV